MPKAYASTVVEMSAEALWARVRDFASIKDWHPAIAAARLEGGAGDQPGVIRHLTLQDGPVIVERLLALDDSARTYSYTIVDGPFPVTRYVSTLRVYPVTDGGRAFVEWHSTFDCEAAQVDAMVSTFAGAVYKGGLDWLRDNPA